MKTLGTRHVAGKDKHFVWQTELVSLVKISMREKRKEDRLLQLVNFEAVKTKHFPKQHRHYAALHQGPIATDCYGAAHRCYWEFENGEGQMSMVILVIIKKSSSQRPSVWVSKQTCCLYAAISCFSLGFCLPVLLFHKHAQVISIIGEGRETYRCFAASMDLTNTSLAVAA